MSTTLFPTSQWLMDGECIAVGGGSGEERLGRENAGTPVMTQACRQEVLELELGQTGSLARYLGHKVIGAWERGRVLEVTWREVSRWLLRFLTPDTG